MKQHYAGQSVLYSAHANGVKCFKAARTHHGAHAPRINGVFAEQKMLLNGHNMLAESH